MVNGVASPIINTNSCPLAQLVQNFQQVAAVSDTILNSAVSSRWIHGDFLYVILDLFMDLLCNKISYLTEMFAVLCVATDEGSGGCGCCVVCCH